MNDSVVALPGTSSKLRLYCLRLSDKILVLGNGGVKTSQRYEDDTLLNGYVMTLQKFEKLLRQEVANGSVNITEATIETDNIFDMKRTSKTLDEMLGPIPANVQAEVDLSFEISDRIDALMRQRGLSKKQFADALGRRPSEITKWLSGQHNFTIATLAMLSSFFGQPIITVG